MDSESEVVEEEEERDSARTEPMEFLWEETSKGTRTNSWSLQMPPTTPFGGRSGWDSRRRIWPMTVFVEVIERLESVF